MSPLLTLCIDCNQPSATSPCATCSTRPERRGYGHAWTKVRAQILARDGHRCTWTEDGKRCLVTAPLDVHHIDRKIDGGTDHPTNLRTLCDRHHALSHDGGRVPWGRTPQRTAPSALTKTVPRGEDRVTG